MVQEKQRNTRLGIFVLAGTSLLILALYFIGNKQNLFGSTFILNARFNDVNGLMSGNNVRIAGINIGTVESVDIINDTTVNVVMVIEDKSRAFIKKNSTARVGTDGLMGNKLVIISSSEIKAAIVADEDILPTIRPLETDEMLRTLSTTNENIKFITTDLKGIVQKFNGPNTLWSILMDTVVAENLKQAIVNIKLTGENTAIVSGDLSNIMKGIKEGKGTMGALITDTALAQKFHQTIVNINLISDSLALVSGDLKYVTRKIKKGEGAVGTLLMDTAFVNNLNQSMINIKDAAGGLNENMEALKHSVLLRRYFKKKEKNEKK